MLVGAVLRHNIVGRHRQRIRHIRILIRKLTACRLAARYRVLANALAGIDRELLRALPFNSGCFALIELPPDLGLESDRVRRALLDRYDTGLIAIAPRFLRIAFCSVRQAALPELVGRLQTAVRELATRGPDAV